MTGTVIAIHYYRGIATYGVAFDSFVNGHECSLPHQCENGYGWWVLSENLSHYYGDGHGIDDFEIPQNIGLLI